MLEQEYLCRLSLEDASKEISKELIKMGEDLTTTIKMLNETKEGYQMDYNRANADGDASENAPLEQAIANLKSITGDIVSAMEKKQKLDKIEDASYVAKMFDFVDLETEIKSIIDSIDNQDDKSSWTNAMYLEFLNHFNANSIDELKENIRQMNYSTFEADLYKFVEVYNSRFLDRLKSDYPDSYNTILKNKYQKEQALEQYIDDGTLLHYNHLLNILEDVRTMKNIRPYNPCGKIVPYSTVRVKLKNPPKTKVNSSLIYTYKIYPDGVSFIDIGVIAANSRLANALLGRRINDMKNPNLTVKVQSTSGSTVWEYEVIEVY